MNKKYFGLMTLAALAGLSSCSNEDAVEQQKSATALSEALYIRPMVNGNMRAVQEYSTSSINQDGQVFRMIGTGNFSLLNDATTPTPTLADVENATSKVTAFDCDVTYTGGKWNLATSVVPTGNSIYWADKSTKATFKAVAPKAVTEGSYTVKGGTTTEGYAAAVDCRPTQEDIIVAYNEGTKKDFTAGVPINFRHVLSRVKFQAVNKDNTNGMFLQIQGIKLVNVASMASLSFPTVSTGEGFTWEKYSPWANASTAQWYYAKESGIISIQNVATDMSSGQDFYLLPQQLTPADGDFLKQTTDKSKQYVAFRIRVFYTSDEASAAVKAAGNSLKNIWPYAKVTTEFTKDEKIFAAGKFIDKTTYGTLSDEEKGKCAFCSETDGYAWACVPIDTKWEPGKKYVYTLNYSAAGLGMTDPEDGAVPGEDIIPESPLKLWFNVTVSEWDDVSEVENL